MSDTYRRTPFRPRDPKNVINEFLQRIEEEESLEELYDEEEEDEYFPPDLSNFS